MSKTVSKTPSDAPPKSRTKIPKRAVQGAADAAGREIRIARYQLGDVVKHRVFPFRGVIFDIDPVFNNTEEWWLSIPAEVRPRKDQPFYHLYAENEETEYIAYVSEQNLLPDSSGDPVRHPQVAETFEQDDDGRYHLRNAVLN
jgi:heat shock protein HspQ